MFAMWGHFTGIYSAKDGLSEDMDLRFRLKLGLG